MSSIGIKGTGNQKSRVIDFSEYDYEKLSFKTSPTIGQDCEDADGVLWSIHSIYQSKVYARINLEKTKNLPVGYDTVDVSDQKNQFYYFK